MTPASDHFRSPIMPTPFEPRISALSETHEWASWAGFKAARSVRDVDLEYTAIRNSASLFDISPLAKYRVEGPGAERFLNRLTVRNVSVLAPWQVHYTLWCDDDGKVLDDGTLFRFSQTRFRLCSQERHLPWLRDVAFGMNVEISDETANIAAVALQGPTSYAVLHEAGFAGARELRPFAMARFALENGAPVTISRTGFTGDLGYELWTAREHALTLWDQLWRAGTPHGLTPIGSRALDVARLEAGLVMANTDFIAAEQALRPDRRRSPFELGLGRFVNFAKGHFNGRRTLLREHEAQSSAHCLVGLDIEGNVAANEARIYHDRRKTVGHVTSAAWSPTTKRSIALASLTRPFGTDQREELWAESYRLYEGEWHRSMQRCRVVSRRFFDPARRRATPPALT